jgi:hypothetical protein
MSIIFDDPVVEQDIRQLLIEQVELLRDIKISNEAVKQVRLMGNDGRYIASNDAGELLISDGPYDLVKFNELAADNTAYNFFGPRGREQFVITGFFNLRRQTSKRDNKRHDSYLRSNSQRHNNGIQNTSSS